MRTDDSAPRAGTGMHPAFPIALYLSAIVVGIFLLRVLGQPWDTNFKVTFPDSYSYLEVAARGPFRPFDERPIVYPTYLWLMGRSTPIAVVVQTCAYAGAFLALCMTAWRVLQSRFAAVVAVVLFVAVAIQPNFAMWNQQILSESMGITLAVASICAWWAFCDHPSPRGVVWAYLWTLLWMGVRDSHIVPTLLIIIPTAVISALVWRGIDPNIRKRLIVGAVVTVGISGWFYVAQDVSNRNQYPFHNNIGVRVLADEELKEYFVEGGMPLNETLEGREGHFSWDDGEVFLQDPELEEYRDWADGPGARRFLLSLGLKFPTWYDKLMDELPNTFSDDLGAYDTYGVADRLPQASPTLTIPLPMENDFEIQLGGPRSMPGLAWWTVLAGLGIAAALLSAIMLRARGAVVLFAAAGLVSAFVELYASYVGDSLEVSRHLVGPLSRLAVMLAICVVIGIDGIQRTMQREPAAAVAEPEEHEPEDDDRFVAVGPAPAEGAHAESESDD